MKYVSASYYPDSGRRTAISISNFTAPSGLLVAGRPISADHEGAASARVIPPYYTTGQSQPVALSSFAWGYWFYTSCIRLRR